MNEPVSRLSAAIDGRECELRSRSVSPCLLGGAAHVAFCVGTGRSFVALLLTLARTAL